MKKSLLIPALCAISMNAANVVNLNTGQPSNSAYPSNPQKNIEYVDDGIVVTYKISEAAFLEDDLYPNSFNIEIPGFFSSDSLGMPAVPTGSFCHIMPGGSEPVLTIIKAEFIDLKYEIAPTRIPKHMKDTVPYSLDNVPPIESYSGFWPKQVCEALPTGMYRRQPLAKVAINPVRYNYDSKTVRVYREIKYKITFSNNASMADVYYEPLSLLNPNCSYMPKSSNSSTYSLREPGHSVSANAGYMLISTPQFKEALYEYVKWKKQLGYNVIEVYDDNWTPEKIKSAIKERYDNDDTFMYLLIVGDDSIVPANRHYEDYEGQFYDGYVLSDYDYACLDNIDDIDSDIYVGRWPIRDVIGLQTLIDKTIWYEKSPPNDDTFYKNAAVFSFFEDGHGNHPHDGKEDSRFVKSCEDVRDYLMANHGFNVQRIYNHYTDTTLYKFKYWPAYWRDWYSNSSTNKDLNLPSDLLHRNGFDWDGTKDNLINAANDGISFIMYSGHGINDAWGTEKDPLFHLSDIVELKNYDRLPLVFSIACCAGKHDSEDCIIRSFLTYGYGGAIAAFAKTNLGYYDTHGRVVSLLFNAIWPSPGLKMHGFRCDISNHNELVSTGKIEPKRQLGAILAFEHYGWDITQGWYERHQRNVLHCFGDPSTYFHTSNPQEIADVDVIRDGQFINVKVPYQEAYIAFYDPINERSYRFYGNNATYCTEVNGGSNYVDVTVYTPNDRPYVDYGKPYYGSIDNKKQYGILGYRDLKNGGVEIDFRLSKSSSYKSVEMHLVNPIDGSIVSSWPISVYDIVADEITTVSMRANPGIMVAHLMIDGMPSYSMKIYVSK